LTFNDAIEYLEQNQITLVMKPEGYPAFRGPDGMPDKALRKVIGYCSHVLEKHRDKIISHYQCAGVLPMQEIGKPPEPLRDPTTIYPDTPLDEQRRIIIERMNRYQMNYGVTGVLQWFSAYTRETGTVTVTDNVPGHATRLGVTVWWGTYWVRVPGHSPPLFTKTRKGKGPKSTYWKAPAGWKPPRDWIKPKGFTWKKTDKNAARANRKKFLKSHYPTRDGDLPD
jgi:hypothetical protein